MPTKQLAAQKAYNKKNKKTDKAIEKWSKAKPVGRHTKESKKAYEEYLKSERALGKSGKTLVKSRKDPATKKKKK